MIKQLVGSLLIISLVISLAALMYFTHYAAWERGYDAGRYYNEKVK